MQWSCFLGFRASVFQLVIVGCFFVVTYLIVLIGHQSHYRVIQVLVFDGSGWCWSAMDVFWHAHNFAFRHVSQGGEKPASLERGHGRASTKGLGTLSLLPRMHFAQPLMMGLKPRNGAEQGRYQHAGL